MNSTTIFRLAPLSLLVLIGLALPVHAQVAAPASTFEELRSSIQLKQNESIEITQSDGTKYKARIVAISDQTISIKKNGIQRDLDELQVREIRHRRPDKWWNGMLIGLGAGAATAVVGVATACPYGDSECQAIAAAIFVPTFVGIGMGTGALVDFAIRKHDTVFARSAAGTNRSLRIAPIVGKKTAGLNVSFKF